MFCSKCGKEIADEAIVCPACGCATANYQHTATNNSAYSQDYIALKEFEEKVNSLYATSIVALVLLLGIGLIFSIAVLVKAKAILIPSITTNPNEIAMFESLKRKLKKALSFANAPLYVLLFLLAPAFFYGQMYGAAILVVAVYAAIVCLIGIPCTKHLNKDLYRTKQ